MKKVFLDELPRRRGKTKQVNWRETVGHNIKFIYDDIEGEIEIIDYFIKNSKGYLTLKCNKVILDVHVGNIQKNKIGNLIGKKTEQYKFDVGSVIKNKRFGKIEILERIKMIEDNRKGYLYKCLICTNEDVISETSLNMNVECNVCCTSPKKVLNGYNDFATTHPWMVSLCWNKEDSLNHSFGSFVKLDWKCPICEEKIKNVPVCSVSTFKLSCKRCGDGVSYPEKIIYGVLRSLNIDFECRKIFQWSNNKQYDFFVPLFNLIIESNGGQHYYETTRGRSLLEEQENDRLKEKLSKDNGIENYLIIDCRHSELDYIKNNILNSELSKFFDLSNVNWVDIEKYAISSLVKESCELFNGDLTSTEISNILKLNISTISKYLKQGSDLKWCNYDPKEEMKKCADRNRKFLMKKVIQVDFDGNFLNEYESASEASKVLNINSTCIGNVCRGKQITAGGFKWIFKEDYEKLIMENDVE